MALGTITMAKEARPLVRGPAVGKLACLDGLRGVAVLLVVLFHLGNGDRVGYHRTVAAVLSPFRYGFTGVHLFLVLSGFCLTHALIRRARARRAPDWPTYMKGRYRRIGPPYYAAMALYLSFPVAALLIGRPGASRALLSVRQVATHVLFIHGFWPDTIDSINTAFWSLSLEFQFYLALPLLFVMAGRFGPAAVLATAAVVSLAWRGTLAALWPGHAYLINGFLPGRLTEFVLGMAVAFWFNDPARRVGQGGVVRFLVAALALLGGAVALTARGRLFATDYVFSLGYTLLLVAVLRAAERPGRLSALFEWRPLVWVGMISYSLYLTHSLFVERTIQVYRLVVPRPSLAADAALIAMVIAIVLAGGWGFYHLVERHFVRSIDAPRPARD